MTVSPLSSFCCVDCGQSFALGGGDGVRYLCPCGGLLDVRHRLEVFRDRFGDLRRAFDDRLGRWSELSGSGVWRYRELILPDLPLSSVVTLGEGTTGLYDGGDLGERLHFAPGHLKLKHEGENPTLSFKDRGMTAAVSWGLHNGARLGICASTGDTSAAMAAYTARAPGMEGVVLLPRGKITGEQLSQATSLGARTLALDTDFDGCMRIVRHVARRPEVYLLNSMNPMRIEGQKSIALEVLHQLDWRAPDWFVLPVGNGGNISALGKALDEARALGLIDAIPRIAGVQAAAADPFTQSFTRGFDERISTTAQPTAASAIRIGDPVSYPKAKRSVLASHGVVVSVSEEELLDGQAVLGRGGIQACPNSGVAVAGLSRLRSEGVIKRDHVVVLILTAHGAKFSSTSLAYHRGELTPTVPRWANPPEELPADPDAVMAALSRS